MAMDGTEVHRWSSNETGHAHRRFHELLPSFAPPYLAGWNHVSLAADGALFVIGTHHMLMKLDWNSNVLWKVDVAAHHDIDTTAGGDVYVLADSIRTADLGEGPVAFQDNYIVVLDAHGVEQRRLSIFDALRRDPRLLAVLKRKLARARVLQNRMLDRIEGQLQNPKAAKRAELSLSLELLREAIGGDIRREAGVKNLLFHSSIGDIIHTNSLQILPASSHDLWEAADLLLCIRELNVMVIVRATTGEVLWAWGTDKLQKPHHATYLDDGNILVFDNGKDRKRSRILEVDPRTGAIEWSYGSSAGQKFFTATRGGCQKLPNGNVLIAETNEGHVFEVTAAGEIVWEYFDTTRLGQKRGAIYRMTRHPHTDLEGLLHRAP